MERREWLGLMAKADATDLMGCWAAANLSPDYTELRPGDWQRHGAWPHGRQG